jgi:hypothetical protein
LDKIERYAQFRPSYAFLACGRDQMMTERREQTEAHPVTEMAAHGGSIRF